MAYPISPAVEEMLMIAPPPARRIDGTVKCMPRKVPVRLMSITLRHSPGSIASTAPYETIPALLTSRLIGPNASSAAVTAARQSSSRVTSRWT